MFINSKDNAIKPFRFATPVNDSKATQMPMTHVSGNTEVEFQLVYKPISSHPPK